MRLGTGEHLRVNDLAIAAFHADRDANAGEDEIAEDVGAMATSVSGRRPA
jgi:hypothetical protein